MKRRISIGAMAACVGLAMGCAAFAEPEPGQNPPMGGPRVRERDVPGVEGAFGEGGQRRRFAAEQKLPPNVFKEAAEKTILSKDAPEDVRVSDEQRGRFERMFKDHQQSVRSYMQEHRTELNELRKKAGEFDRAKRPGNKDSGGDDMKMEGEGGKDERDVIAARERMKEINGGAPKVEDVYTKVWTELTGPQRAALDGKIAEFRRKQAKDREENYVRQKLGKKPPRGGPEGNARPPEGGQPPKRRPGAEGGPRPDGGAGSSPFGGAPRGERPDARIFPERRDRLMRMFERLTPEQQDQLLQRLEQRMRDEGMAPGTDGRPSAVPRRDGPNGQRRGTPKPPPDMDDVRVPPPPPEADEPR